MVVDTRLLIRVALFAKQHERWRASELVAANMPREWIDCCDIRLVDALIGGETDLNPAFRRVLLGNDVCVL